MLREMQEIQNLATKYSKAELGRMVQLGMIDPQKAMMAGMMIQRIERQNAQPPQTTVAQDILGMPPVPNQAPQGQPQQPQGQVPQGQAPVPQQAAPQMPPQGMAEGGGVERLPSGDVGSYADGGIVAFADGGDTEKKYKYGKLEEMARAAAEKYGVDPDKFARLIETESHYKPGVASYAGKDAGLGIAQLSKHHGLTDAQRLDPKFSLNYAAKMFSDLVDKAGGDYRRALEKYKGVKTEKGRRRMEAHIAQVLGEEPRSYARLADATRKASPRSRPADMGLPTLANAYMERDIPEPHQTFIPEYAQAQPAGGVNQLAMLGSPYTQQQGGDTGEYDIPEELQGGYAGGGVIALARGGVPRFGGASGSWVQSNSVPSQSVGSRPLTLQEQQIYDEYGIYPQNVTPQQEQAAKQSAENVQVRQKLQQRLKEIESKSLYGRPSQEDLREMESIRQQLNAAPNYIPLSSVDKVPSGISQSQVDQYVGANKRLNEMLPEIASPAKALQGTQPEWKGDVDGSPYVSPEVKARAQRTRVDGEAAGDSFISKLPPIQSYMDKVNLKAETAPVPEATTPEQERTTRIEQEQKAGFNPKMYEDLIGKIEDRKGDYATEKERAIGEAIMQAGFRLMGARRGQEFQALSEGAQEGLKSYQGALKEFKSRQEKLDERIEAFQIADAQAKQTGARADIASAQRQNELRQKALESKADAQNKVLNTAAQLALGAQGHDATILAQAMAGQASRDVAGMRIAEADPIARNMATYNEILRTQGQAAADAWFERLSKFSGVGKSQNLFLFEDALKIVAANPVNAGLTPEQLAKKAKELMAAQSIGSSTAVSGNVDTKNPLLTGK